MQRAEPQKADRQARLAERRTTVPAVSSPHARQIAQFESMTALSPRLVQQRKLAAMIDNSPRQAAQIPAASASRPVLQGAFVYRMELGRIVKDRKLDAFYKSLHFASIPAADGNIIWCDPRNTNDVIAILAQAGTGVALPDDAETIQDAGVNIEQDGERWNVPADQEYYFMGQGMAWTTRIHTCTALAIYDSFTGNSFLCHADGGDGNAGRIIQHLGRYLGMVPDQRFGATLTVNIFTAEDTKAENTSLETVVTSLATLKLPEGSVTHVKPEDTIAVFSGGPATRLRPSADLLLAAVKAYTDAHTAAGKAYISTMLARKPDLAQNEKIADELTMCYRVLEAEKLDSAFLLPYLEPDDIERYKRSD